MDWTIGLLDYLTIFLDHFSDHFIVGPLNIGTKGWMGRSLSVLREGWVANCCY